MPEINVTALLEEDCSLLSASRAELGPNAGKITWENCLELAERLPLVTDKNRNDLQDHFAEYGAWDREEIDGWSDQELSAMVWQEAAADMREFEDHCDSDWDRYQAEAERGSICGRLSRTDAGEVFIYLGF
jgi:hypothetical protein